MTAKEIIEDLELVRCKSPLVHNITNYVVMNSTANALLAVGASPVMAHAVEEVEDMVGHRRGAGHQHRHAERTLDRGHAPAAAAADSKGIPIVLRSGRRRRHPLPHANGPRPAPAATPAIIRGNASEIIAIAGDGAGRPRAWTAPPPPRAPWSAPGTSASSTAAWSASAAKPTHRRAKRRGPDPQRPRPHAKVTGLGCTATALCGAFAAVEPDPSGPLSPPWP